MPRTDRDEKITVRIAEPLRAELEAAAGAEGRTLSDVARRALVEFASRRIVDREKKAA
jgi:uncharacterized protein (DUF1778 family)